MNKINILDRIINIHSGDKDQLDFVISEEKRIIVTAPAGCGKTKSMISKIAYEIITNEKMNYKKILALTFSVNAAAKIQEDTRKILPTILNNESANISRKLDVANYHNFSIKLIRKHGYIFNENLRNIDNFVIIGEYAREIMTVLTSTEVSKLKRFDFYLKNVNIEMLDELEEDYLNILLKRLIPRNIITFNGLLLIAYKLLEVDTIQRFYKKYYNMVIVDEFQDTNYLSYKLITRIFDNNKIILMGDHIQKIYGFLGALPNIFNYMTSRYNMVPLEFKTNYRFKNNEKMKLLDSYLRGIFKNYNNIKTYDESANINFKVFKKSSSEARFIVDHMLQKTKQGNKVVLLVRVGFAANHVISELESRGIKYFNALFNDSDPEYVNFHEFALRLFQEESGVSKSVSYRVLNKVLERIENFKEEIIKKSEKMYIFESMKRLLEALFNSLKDTGLTKIERYNKIIFTLATNSLKHIMNELDEDITLTTIHGSKGLEWDFVYIPELTSYTFPSGKSLCSECSRISGNTLYPTACEFNFPFQLKRKFEEELSLFYVAVTRAKKDVFLFANTDLNQWGKYKKVSCLALLPNLKLVENF